MEHLLPTENELSEQYHVSRVTVRKALAALDSQGYLEKNQEKEHLSQKRKCSVLFLLLL